MITNLVGDNPAKLIMTEKELASYLGVSYWTVRSWRLQKENPLPTVGSGRILYRLQTVMDWMSATEANNARRIAQ